MQTENIAVLIPIVAIVFGVGIGMWGMFLSYRKRKEIFALYHQERMAAIDKGVEVPPLPDAFFSEEARPASSSPRRHLLKGMVFLFVGLALLVALYAQGHGDYALYSLILVGIGAAHLIYYAAEGKKAAEAMEAAEAAKLVETKLGKSV